MVAESPGRFILRFLIELGQLLDLRALSGSSPAISAGDQIISHSMSLGRWNLTFSSDPLTRMSRLGSSRRALRGPNDRTGIRPIRIMRRLSVRQEPVHAVGFLQQSDFAQSGEEIILGVEVPGLSQRYQPGSEVEQLELRGLLGAVQPIPIQPCGLIVLRVGVVVCRSASCRIRRRQAASACPGRAAACPACS